MAKNSPPLHYKSAEFLVLFIPNGTLEKEGNI